jgi:hypothetical protein
MGGRLEVGVAQTSLSAPANDHRLVGFGEVGKDLIGVVVPNDGARWNVDKERLAGFAVHLLFSAVPASFGKEFLIVLKLEQACEIRSHAQDDIAAASAIPTIWSAFRHKLFAPEGHGSTSAITSFNVNTSAIDEHETSRNRRDGDVERDETSRPDYWAAFKDTRVMVCEANRA